MYNKKRLEQADLFFQTICEEYLSVDQKTVSAGYLVNLCVEHSETPREKFEIGIRAMIQTSIEICTERGVFNERESKIYISKLDNLDNVILNFKKNLVTGKYDIGYSFKE